MADLNILFCCMGNICRSPMAEGLFKALVAEAGLAERVAVDSAGTHATFASSPPDPRAQRLLAKRGIDISELRSRPITRADFERFDLILVMDADNLDALRFTCSKAQSKKLRLILDYVPKFKVRDVPDPYNRDDEEFLKVFELLDQATRGLLRHVQSHLDSR